jgi:uncharacterized protein (UPF0248 family)
MAPIQDLLNRIRWDPIFAQGEFELGYFDRMEDRVVVIPFRLIQFPSGASDVFELMDSDGRIHRVPFHRVRDLFKNGQCIWHRA